MTDAIKERLTATVWRHDQPYDEKAQIRLVRSCEIIRADCDARRPLGRYRLLDVGCGAGALRRWLPAEQFEITGLELSDAAAAIAAGRYDACKVTDVEKPWPVERASYHGLHAGAILEHVIDWHAPLNYANRALIDGGLIVICVPNLRYWKEIRKLLVGKQPHWLRGMRHLHGYTPNFLRQLVTLHGFEVTGLEADRVNLIPRPRCVERWMRRALASIGSVLILTAYLRRRVRVEDICQANYLPNHKPVGLRSIEIEEDW